MFTSVNQKLQSQFAHLASSGLFQVEIDREKIWQIYLDAFSTENRQSNNCNACKSFLRQYGGIVGVGADFKMVSLWDFDPQDEEYNAAIKALSEYVHSLPISGIFLNGFPKCGTLKNLDPTRNVIWNHLYLELPATYVKPNIGPLIGTALDNKSVLKRSLDEITDSAVETTLELIGQNSLYRGQEFKGMLTEFQKLKEEYKKTKAKLKDNFCWLKSSKVSGAVARIRNSSIGTLLNDLSEGVDLDKAVTSFERVVAPQNYKRPENLLVTPKMIEQAKKRLEEMGAVESLYRRQLSTKDLSVANALFVHRANTIGGDIFTELAKSTSVNMKSFSKVEEVSIDTFIHKILPVAKSIKILLENRHLANLVTLVGPKNSSDVSLFKWQNSYSWHYTGGVADSIKDRVKNAGGNVEGVLRISLSWHNHDDLDLHLIEPNQYRIYYPNKGVLSPSKGKLDIDMNAGIATTREPVENIFWLTEPATEGRYKVMVNNFNKREAADTGFEIQVEYRGEINDWSFPRNGAAGQNFTAIEFDYSKQNGITFIGGSGSSSSATYPTKKKWGLETGRFHQVKALCLSPNFWNSNIGNKHFMFFLEGCQTDDCVRGFYNEFLREDFSADRRVFEILGSRVEVEKVEDELSGIGFSETLRNDVIVEVSGVFKRLIKVKF